MPNDQEQKVQALVAEMNVFLSAIDQLKLGFGVKAQQIVTEIINSIKEQEKSENKP